MGFTAYSAPAAGYLTAWPPADLGPDLVAALHRTGIAAADLHTCAAFGWAAVPLDAAGRPLPGAVRISAPDADADGARVVAAGLLARGPVALCKAVAHAGPVTLWARVERLDVGAVLPPGAALLGPGAVRLPLTKAAAGPKFGVDVGAFARKLATQLHTPQVSDAGLAAVKDALAALDVNWNKATKAQIDQAFAHAREALGKVAAATGGHLLPEWREKIRVSLLDTAAAARKWQHDYTYPRIGLSLRQPDQLAIAQVANQQGWFLRSELGARSDKLTAEGRKIVDVGIREGWGRDDIGRALQNQLPNLWGAYGFNYARTVAAVAVNRARAFSEASGYQDAGIEQLEIVAMLDERTTDMCRCLDGQILPVGGCYQHALAAASVPNPEDIYKVSPFLGARWDPQAEAIQIKTRIGGQIATVSRSGVGAVDDRGDFQMQAAGAGLLDKKVGMPPYHFKCRTTTVPRISSVQVPKGEIPVAAPVPAQPPTPAPPAMAPPALGALGAGQAAAPTALPAQRPLVSMPAASLDNPSTVPSLPAVQPGPVVNPTPPGGPGTSGQIVTFRQVMEEAHAKLENQYDAVINRLRPLSVELFEHPKFGPHAVVHAEMKVAVEVADAKGWDKVTQTTGYGKKLAKGELDAMAAELRAQGWKQEGQTWTPPPKPPKAAPPPSPLPDATPAQGAGITPPLAPTPAIQDYVDTLVKTYAEALHADIVVQQFSPVIQGVGTAAEKYMVKLWGKGLNASGELFALPNKATYDKIHAEAVQNLGKLGPPHVPPPTVAPPGVTPAKAIGLPSVPLVENLIGSTVQQLETKIGFDFAIHGVNVQKIGGKPSGVVYYSKPGSSSLFQQVTELDAAQFKQMGAELKKLNLSKKTGYKVPAELAFGYPAYDLHYTQTQWIKQAEAAAAKKAAREGKDPTAAAEAARVNMTRDKLGPIRKAPPTVRLDPWKESHESAQQVDQWKARARAAGAAPKRHVQKYWPDKYTNETGDYAGQDKIFAKVGDKADGFIMKHLEISPAAWAKLTEEEKLARRYEFGSNIKSSWNGNSMDHKTDMHALHLSAREEFGLVEAATQPLRPSVVKEVYQKYTAEELAGMRAYLRGLYNFTQAELKKAGIKTLRLYRGMSLEPGWEHPEGIKFGASAEYQTGLVALQPVSSFSPSPSVAHNFSDRHPHGMVIHVEVDASRVLGSGLTGLGTQYETEFCLLGGKGDVAGVFWDKSQARGYMGEQPVFSEFSKATNRRADAAERAATSKGIAA